MLSLPPESIEYYDGTCWPAIDEVLSRTPPLPPVALTALDLYLEWCRGPGRAHPRADDAADAFFAWFREQRPSEYAAFAAAEAERLARRPTS
jgi:hypothetical protein